MEAIYGIVRNGTLVLETDSSLPDGTRVLITPLESAIGSPQAILQVIESTPSILSGDVDLLDDVITKERKMPNYSDPFETGVE